MTTPKTAWVQLYQARQIKADITETRSPGRPPSPIPRRKVGLTLSQGEITELEALAGALFRGCWGARFPPARRSGS